MSFCVLQAGYAVAEEEMPAWVLWCARCILSLLSLASDCGACLQIS